MLNTVQYFELAHTEEISGNDCAALLLYLSAFCNSFNSDAKDLPCGTIAKIQRLQNRLSISNLQLLELVHSYGPLSNDECRKLLTYSIQGYLAGIKTILSGLAYGY